MMANFCKMWQLSTLLFFLTCVLAKQKSSLLELNEETWSDMLQGEWLVKFYAPWCPACKALTSVWDSVATWSEDLEIKVAKIDVTENPGLSGRFLVTSLPTIYHVKDGAFRTYRGARAENDIISFVDDKKWTEVDPVPWYTSPTAIHMSALGMFFKASMAIRDLHDKMTTDYGIPVWGSYTIFAVATIILGLMLGLLIVFLCDAMLPNHPPDQQSYVSARPRPPPGYQTYPPYDDDKDSDIIEDDLPRPRPEEEPVSEISAALPNEAVQQEGTASQEEQSDDDDDVVELDLSQSEELSQEELSQEEDNEELSKEEEAKGGEFKVERPKSARRRKLKASTD